MDYLSSEKLDWEQMQQERQAVLRTRETGSEVNLEEAVEFHSTLPPSKNFARRMGGGESPGDYPDAAPSRSGRSEKPPGAAPVSWPAKGKRICCPQLLIPIPAKTAMKRQRKVWTRAAKVGRSLLNGFPCCQSRSEELPDAGQGALLRCR